MKSVNVEMRTYLNTRPLTECVRNTVFNVTFYGSVSVSLAVYLL